MIITKKQYCQFENKVKSYLVFDTEVNSFGVEIEVVENRSEGRFCIGNDWFKTLKEAKDFAIQKLK